MQLSHMPVSGVRPVTGLRLSCMALTEPLDVFVVNAAHVAPAEGPKRSSLPSRLPSDCSTGRPTTAGTLTIRTPLVLPGSGIWYSRSAWAVSAGLGRNVSVDTAQ